MRRLSIGLITLVLALGVSATPAVAHDITCDSGYFCVWPYINYDTPSEGDHAHFASDSADWPLFGIENDDDSVKNRESYRVLVYAGSNYSEGYLYCTQPGEVEGDINGAYDDNGDSNDMEFGVTSCGTLRRP